MSGGFYLVYMTKGRQITEDLTHMRDLSRFWSSATSFWFRSAFKTNIFLQTCLHAMVLFIFLNKCSCSLTYFLATGTLQCQQSASQAFGAPKTCERVVEKNDWDFGLTLISSTRGWNIWLGWVLCGHALLPCIAAALPQSHAKGSDAFWPLFKACHLFIELSRFKFISNSLFFEGYNTQLYISTKQHRFFWFVSGNGWQCSADKFKFYVAFTCFPSLSTKARVGGRWYGSLKHDNIEPC